MRHALLLPLAWIAACSAPQPWSPTVFHAAQGALGPYSAAVETGDLVFVTGRIGDTRGEFENEVATTIFALEIELAKMNLTLGDVVSATCYLTDMEMYERFNAVYGERMPKPYPARIVVGVSALPAGAHVGISVVARKRP